MYTSSELTHSAGKGRLITEGINLMFNLQQSQMKNIALYLQVWNQSLPSYCVLPNLHHCLAHPRAFQITVFFEPHLHCSHPGLFLVISSLLYCYFSLPTKTLVQLLTPPLLIYCNVFCLASIFHLLPQIIFVPLSWFGETPLQPHTYTHTFGSLLGLSLLFASNSKVLFLSFKALQIHIHWHFFLLLHTASICYQCFTSFSTHVLHAKLRKQQKPKKDLNKDCGYYPLAP